MWNIHYEYIKWVSIKMSNIGNHFYATETVQATGTNSEGGYGINTQVEKSKNMTIVKFMECDLNKLFWIFVESWMW